MKHGVFGNILPTLLRITQVADADVPVVVGTAPVHRIVGGLSNVNQTFLCLAPGPTLAAFGCATPAGQTLGSDWNLWTLNEAFYMCFTLLNQFNKPSPVFVNVFNNFLTVASASMNCINGVITIPFATADVAIDSVVVQNTAGTITLVKGVNYITGYNANGDFLITILDANPTATYKVAYNKANPSAVTASTIIGGTSAGNINSGLSCINDVWPNLTIVPGILIAPGWMQNPLVLAAADALVQSVNGIFKARTASGLLDNTNARNATAANTFKGTIACNDSREDAIWPPICQFGPLNIHSETVNTFMMGSITQNPLYGNGVPYWSISNKLVPGMTGTALADGTPVIVRPNDAQYLGTVGIMTYVQYEDGFFTWGNRSAAWPLSNDVTQVFAVVQRELDWLSNTTVLTLRPWVDNPTNQRLIESITLTMQVFLSSLVSSQALLKGIIEFLQVDNPTNNLLNGIVTFHYLVTPPLPAEDIENNFEFDVSGLNVLFNIVNTTASDGLASGGGLVVH